MTLGRASGHALSRCLLPPCKAFLCSLYFLKKVRALRLFLFKIRVSNASVGSCSKSGLYAGNPQLQFSCSLAPGGHKTAPQPT